MNYIKQIRFLWTKAKRHSLGANEIAMYFYLLEISNSNQWENPVMEPNATLQHAIGVKSFNTLKEVRNRLQQFGLLRFKTKNGSSVVEYDFYDVELETFSKIEEVTAKVVDEVVAKVTAKVPDEVGEKHLLYNKPKLKQEESAQVQHGLFFEKFFSAAADYDREVIGLQVREQEIKRQWVEVFNAHLHTERTAHAEYHEWMKHLRSWLPKKIKDLKAGDQVAVQIKATRKFLN